MATNNSDLNFVRCPSCRSLVPAISARCRMCGAALNAATKVSENINERIKSGRIRQKTLADGSSDLTDAAKRLREELLGSSASQASIEDSQPEESVSDKDQVSSRTEEQSEEWIESNQERRFESTDDYNPLAEYLSDSTETEDDYRLNVEDSQRTRVLLEEEALPVSDDDDVNESFEVKSASISDIQSFREQKQDSDLAASQNIDRSVEKTNKPSSEKIKDNNDHLVQSDHSKKVKMEEKNMENEGKTIGEKEGLSAKAEGKSTKTPPSATAAASKFSSAEPKAGTTIREGRLYGWLVSFLEPQGSAIEVREGKYFLSRNGIKKNDILIDDDSISSPHALVVVGKDHGFTIQDLLSERGLFVRRKGETVYHREEGTTQVYHGDFIRLGDLEFIISLIPHVGDV